MRLRPLAALSATALAACGADPASLAEPQAPWPPFALRGRIDADRPLTWQVDDAPGPLPADALASVVANATGAWAATGFVDLRRARPGDAADLVIGWRRGSHGTCEPFGATTAVAHSGPVGPGAFVHFDAGRSWLPDDDETDGRVSLLRTARHELGHALGLDHSVRDDAVMTTGMHVPTRLGAADLAGLQSLYGPPGAPGPADLQIADQDGEPTACLRAVALPGRTAWTVFDTDGDGAAELLVWRTDKEGQGALATYAFAPGPRLRRSRGPFAGLLVPGAAVRCRRTAGGERQLLVAMPNGRVVVRAFDEVGVPVQSIDGGSPPDAATVAALPQPVRGDLDGDGDEDAVRAAGR